MFSGSRMNKRDFLKKGRHRTADIAKNRQNVAIRPIVKHVLNNMEIRACNNFLEKVASDEGTPVAEFCFLNTGGNLFLYAGLIENRSLKMRISLQNVNEHIAASSADIYNFAIRTKVNRPYHILLLPFCNGTHETSEAISCFLVGLIAFVLRNAVSKFIGNSF